MYLIFEDALLIGVADDARKAGKLIEEQLNQCVIKGRFGNSATKGTYVLGGHTYPGVKGMVYEYESDHEDDPMYRIVPFELNELFPGCEKLPTTVYNP